MASVVALALVGGACKSKEEAPVTTAPPEAGATAPAGASATAPAKDEWAWADTPSGGTASAPAPVSGGGLDVEESRPVAQPPAPPRATAPKPKPKPSEPKQPTNEFEAAPYGEDKPAEVPAPAKVAYTAAAGTALEVMLDTALDSETATVGQPVTATLDADLTDGAGHVVLPRGTRLVGTVTEAVSAKKVKKKSSLAFQLTKAELPDGTSVPVAAGKRIEGKGYTKKDAAIIGGSAAGGAILGQVLGGDTGSTAAGAVIGGAIGTGVAMSKKGEDVAVAAGTALGLTLETPVTVQY